MRAHALLAFGALRLLASASGGCSPTEGGGAEAAGTGGASGAPGEAGAVGRGGSQAEAAGASGAAGASPCKPVSGPTVDENSCTLCPGDACEPGYTCTASGHAAGPWSETCVCGAASTLECARCGGGCLGAWASCLHICGEQPFAAKPWEGVRELLCAPLAAHLCERAGACGCQASGSCAASAEEWCMKRFSPWQSAPSRAEGGMVTVQVQSIAPCLEALKQASSGCEVPTSLPAACAQLLSEEAGVGQACSFPVCAGGSGRCEGGVCKPAAAPSPCQGEGCTEGVCGAVGP